MKKSVSKREKADIIREKKVPCEIDFEMKKGPIKMASIDKT